MPSLALIQPVHHPRRTMSKVVDNSGNNDAAALLGRALAVLRRRAGLSQAAAGQRANMSGQGWAKYENDQAPTPADLEKERLGLSGSPQTSNVVDFRKWVDNERAQTLPIRDRVQAGAWLMADDTSQAEPKQYPFARDPRFPYADQWLSEVIGDSVDRLGIFEGDLVHCVDFEGAGIGLQSGQIVEIERLRFGGSERELSIKQVELTANGPLLWPRSSNPRWQAPLGMTDGAEDDEVLVRIRGLIVQSIRRF
jgi:SOS-response transcriptional repressor LexA